MHLETVPFAVQIYIAARTQNYLNNKSPDETAILLIVHGPKKETKKQLDIPEIKLFAKTEEEKRQESKRDMRWNRGVDET